MKKRNPQARVLADPRYRKRVVKSAKTYRRNRVKKILVNNSRREYGDL